MRWMRILAILAMCAAWAVAGEPTSTAWAIVVGVNRYDAADITALQFAEADAQGVAQALHQGSGVPARHLLLLTCDGKDRLRATRPNLVYWLRRMKEVVKPDDTFMLYFAGHGVSLQKESYLLLADAMAESVDTLEESALKVSRLRALLQQIPASRKLVVLDACRNDPRAGRGDGDNPLSDALARGLTLQPARSAASQPDVAATLFACKVGQRSYEWPEKGHGFFSYFLIEGLNGAAGNGHGQVTLTSLVDYMETHVPEQMRLWKGQAVQTPWAEIVGTGAGRWVLGASRAATATPPSLSPEQLPSPTADPNPSARAQEAFDAGRFAEPSGDNAIELARQVLRADPTNAAARQIEQRAAAAYENQALLAVSNHTPDRALAIYRRLFQLYPDRRDYLQQVQSLEKPPAPPIVGRWDWTTYSLFTLHRVLTLREDGTGAADDLTVTWKCVDAGAGKYKVRWSNGWTHVVTLSADGTQAEGRNDLGIRVHGVRRKP